MKDDNLNSPHLAYSPLISIEDLSEPFRAFLGAILSIVEDVPIECSTFNLNMQLDVIAEEQDSDPNTHSRTQNESTDPQPIV